MTVFAKWGAVLALLAALVVGADMYRDHVYNLGHQAAIDERAARDGVAVLARVADNVVLVDKQRAVNAAIEKAKDAEITPIVQRVYIDRVRVGAGTCGPAAPAKTDDAGGSNSADSPGRLVREDVERDTRALNVDVETDLATGRACQAWGRENGFMP